MTVIAGLGWTAPWLLAALIALPILWLILRAVPPMPLIRRFPGTALLLGLTDDDQVSDRTPWWLLLLRMLAVAALIVGLAGPVLDPQRGTPGSDAPVLIVLDGSWAGAARWPVLMDALAGELAQARNQDRLVGVLSLSAPEPVVLSAASDWQTRLAGLAPSAWQPADVPAVAEALSGIEAVDTLWISDGLDYPARARVLELLQERGAVEVLEAPAVVAGLKPAAFADGRILLDLVQSAPSVGQSYQIVARGRDPVGIEDVLGRVAIEVPPGERTAQAELDLPAELRARITHFEIDGLRSAGAVALSDDSLQRREVALVAGRADSEGIQLLSPLHYLRKAFEAQADVIEGPLGDVLPANPDVIVLADIARLAPGETDALQAWVDGGGLLLRFAGPQVAASDISRSEEDPLMPVRLRSGGRSVGGAMSWGTPKTLAAFPDTSPFYGLPVPDDVEISAQVVAQPDPDLADRVIAGLSDGTPLVTRKPMGQGQVVLFHVTASAEWSTLPLSGLFLQMLERLALSTTIDRIDPEQLAGTTWTPQRVLDGFGNLRDAGVLPGVDGADLLGRAAGPAAPPGVYRSDGALLARNVLDAQSTLEPSSWPDEVPVSVLSGARERPLGGYALALALLLVCADILASLALTGRLIGPAAAGALALAVALPAGDPAWAQEQNDAFAVDAVSELRLAYVLTGNREVDAMSDAGLTGLSNTLYFRTSVEPAEPAGIDLETDELAFFPLLFWPITPDQPRPSVEAYAKLNDYLRAGGMILFDTRDGDVAGFGGGSPNGRKLQSLARPLDIPALEPVPSDHVLTRTFYLLQDFPGRYTGRDVWVEAAPPNAEAIEGVPFRNLNDGVSPVIIGGNDWAAAWAVDARGAPLVPVGRGFGGERQRELAYRFGINLVMHVLTGNYKSDQVHVPELLERLSQ